MDTTAPTGGDQTAVPGGSADPDPVLIPPRVQSVDRAARLLLAVANPPRGDATTTALAQACHLNRATAWRLLTTLEANGLVARDVGGRWFPGPALADLAGESPMETLRRAAHDELVALGAATHETAAFAVLTPSALTYVDEVAPDAIVAATWRGRTVPLHATSTGKAALAGPGSPRIEDLRLPLERFTETTVTDPCLLAEELEDARRLGYAGCQGEYERSAWGVSAPVVLSGRVVAVVSVWGPAGRVSPSRLTELGPLVAAVARRLSNPPAVTEPQR
ncbi:Repressor of aceBA operon [Nostocoides japonicum T1-X7]|uniref:Repressor of aceBA operon n=1 Tax=Nostocoides japonicum T1-X7 TaxID=1194083 RepID=A0A077M4H5_9MICO|nr:IclR family transcriptional regulator [Tetrasphaera japonica]CCH79029.1 Repressor of aceBA operon [Tetrasphaera japonica T1-X7]